MLLRKSGFLPELSRKGTNNNIMTETFPEKKLAVNPGNVKILTKREFAHEKKVNF